MGWHRRSLPPVIVVTPKGIGVPPPGAGSTSTPTVTTQAVTSIGNTTATGNGTVVSDGNLTITERGVCWSTSINPTTSDSKATSAGTTGAFTASITGLTASTGYHVRAYAINALGTSYGSDVTFTSASTSGSVASIVSVSRNGVSTAGGQALDVTVTGLTGTPTFTLNGVNCTTNTTTGSTSANITVPANAAGTYALVCGGQSLASAIEYLPAPSGAAIAAWSDQSSSISPFISGGGTGVTFTVSTAQALPGTTHSILGTFNNPGVDGGAQLQSPTFTCNDTTHANGVYFREYVYFPSGSIANLGAQCKWHLCRSQAHGNNKGGYMLGQGSDFASSGSTSNVAVWDDGSTGGVLNTTSGKNASDQWLEVIVWYRWNVGAANGEARIWFNGKALAAGTYGPGTAFLNNWTDFQVYCNQAFVKAPSGIITKYSANLWLGDGWPDTQTVG